MSDNEENKDLQPVEQPEGDGRDEHIEDRPLSPEEAAKRQEEEVPVDTTIPPSEDGKKKSSKMPKVIFAVVALGLFTLYLINQGLGGGSSAPEQQMQAGDGPPKQGAGQAVIGKGDDVRDNALDLPTNPEIMRLNASDAAAREASAIAANERGESVVSLNRGTGAEGWDPTKLPPPPKDAVPTEQAQNRPSNSNQKQEERVNPKAEAVNQFLSVYMSYPTPGLAVSSTRAQELEAMAEQQQQAAEGGGTVAPGGAPGQTGSNAKQQGNVLVDAGDMVYGESTLAVDSRRPGSPVRVVIRGGRLNGAILMGTNAPVGGNGQVFKMTTMTIRGKGTYPISAVLINPEDYDMTNIADKRRDPSFLRTLSIIGVHWAARFGQAKINNNSTTTITNNAVVTNNGRQRNKDLAVGALGEGIGDAEDAATGYINEKLAPYSKVLPGKEVGVLFLSSVVL